MMFLNRFLINPMRVIRACNYTSPRAVTRRTLTIECLKSRCVLKVSGEETSVYMQGLITNDMQHLEGGACSMYTMFLNTKGRVMYDAIIYRTSEKDAFLIECDSSAQGPLQKHLTMYRIRRKITIESLVDVNVWTIFDPAVTDINASVEESKSPSGTIVPCNTIDGTQTIRNNALIEMCTSFGNKHNLIVCRDPRLAALGIRIIAPKTTDIIKIAAEEVGAITLADGDTSYKTVRYRLGVGEGVDDLPPGKCFPLEANCDYLHGVSFHKGCYIGQELTARTHHTGVVRKRLMPIEFDTRPSVAFVPDAPIKHGNGCSNAVGKLRGAENNTGLALLRITEALEAPSLKVLDVTAQAMKPNWWPQEAPKERIVAGKDSTK